MSAIITSCAQATGFGNLQQDVPRWVSNLPSGINFIHFEPSPDGQKIVFEYVDCSLGNSFNNNYLGIGILERNTGKLVRIPNPPGKQFSNPSFSRDGKHLVVSKGTANGLAPNQIAVVDLLTLETRDITPQGDKADFPIFQPGTGNILYVNNFEWRVDSLVLLDPETKTRKVVLSEKDGFYNIRRPSFVGRDRVIFNAEGPSNKVLSAKIRSFPTPNQVASIAYQMQLGQLPSMISEASERRDPFGAGAFSFISANEDGKTIVYAGTVENNAKNEKGRVIRELYKIENGATTQLTNLQKTVVFTGVSSDGSTIAFGLDPDAGDVPDLYIYDVRKGEVITTNLLSRIKSDPAFALK